MSFSFPHHRGQGWFPVIPALSVNVCCSVSTSIKLFLSCSAVTELTAHNCHLIGLAINHTDCIRLRMHVCMNVHMSLVSFLFFFFFKSVSFLRVTVGYEERSFCPLDPGNANGLAKRSAGKWGIEESFHSLSSLSPYISPLHFPFHEKTCLWMLVISI